MENHKISEMIGEVESVSRNTRKVARNITNRSRVRVDMKDRTIGGNVESLVRELEELLTEWNLNLYSPLNVAWALRRGTEMSLTVSEVKCLACLVDNVGYDKPTIERNESPDFVVGGRLGIEVKRDDNYKLSRKQLQAASELDAFHIYKSTRSRCELHDVIDWIGLNEYEGIRGYY